MIVTEGPQTTIMPKKEKYLANTFTRTFIVFKALDYKPINKIQLNTTHLSHIFTCNYSQILCFVRYRPDNM